MLEGTCERNQEIEQIHFQDRVTKGLFLLASRNTLKFAYKMDNKQVWVQSQLRWLALQAESMGRVKAEDLDGGLVLGRVGALWTETLVTSLSR
jgi:hypothetical protein